MWLKSGASKRQAGRLTKCSFTVAGTQQSWRDGNLSLGWLNPATLPASLASISRVRAASRHNLSAIKKESSPADSPRIIARPTDCRHDRRESQSAIRTTSLQQLIFRFPLRAMRAPKVTTPDINHVRKGSRHFCAAGTFCASFRHAKRPATPAPTADLSFIRKTEQHRAQFVAGVFDRCRD